MLDENKCLKGHTWPRPPLYDTWVTHTPAGAAPTADQTQAESPLQPYMNPTLTKTPTWSHSKP